MKHAKGIFIDSSYRRAGLLKTLLQGFRHDQDGKEASDKPSEHCDRVYSSPGAWGSGDKSGKSQIKNAASL